MYHLISGYGCFQQNIGTLPRSIRSTLSLIAHPQLHFFGLDALILVSGLEAPKSKYRPSKGNQLYPFTF
ncbi:hypothetical protein CK203_040049 [Vitis vinifera]|uniref:Uncharacterized protein n=1 Tax=Vitis vinifera TaxID=29760 RepID=A0A438IDY8_VITVI|nr:hypothetical protein CK203_040049 [Vitis vinifera]